jgi:hypothetical protein
MIAACARAGALKKLEGRLAEIIGGALHERAGHGVVRDVLVRVLKDRGIVWKLKGVVWGEEGARTFALVP